MKTQDIFDFISNIELFNGLTESEQSLVAEHIEVKTYQQEDNLFVENQLRKDIFILYKGEVELLKKDNEGVEQRQIIFTSGDFFGEGSLMENSKHSTTARCLNEVTVFSIPNSFWKKHSDIAIKLMSNIVRVVTRRLSQSNTNPFRSASQYISTETRKEHDLLGWRDVPEEVYFGIQSLRGLENFHISGTPISRYPELVNSLAIVKEAAAQANYELNLIPVEIRDAIVQACKEIRGGKFHFHFVVDMIQGGAGTSTNMNANEVIANRALEILGHKRGEYEYCHPNNHVNLSQSTNDAYPTAMQLAIFYANLNLVKVLQELVQALRVKEKEFERVIKMGRTQLQDAVPMTLGQTFGAFAAAIEGEAQQLNNQASLFLEVNMGATAIGTGINSEPGYSEKVINHLKSITGLKIHLARNLIEATSDTSSFVSYSSTLKRLAVKLSKICNDLRLLSSGPRCGLSEINLPPMQPGSSIMPGKVNPVIPEVVNQIAFKVIGNDLSVTMASEAAQLELNVMEPVIVQSIFESMEMLKSGIKTLICRCITGITANEKRCREYVENSIGLVTALNPFIGYEASNRIAAKALETGSSVYDLVLEEKLMSKEELEERLRPENMIHANKMK